MAEGSICESPGDQDCPICLQTLNVPRILPCQHNFCHKCLTDFIVNSGFKEGSKPTFNCPVCRAQIYPTTQDKAPQEWVYLFPQNTRVLGYSELSNAKVEYACDSCLERDDFKKANGFCIDCKEYVCENCIEVHKKFDILTTHTILTMKELPQNVSTVIKAGFYDNCGFHKGKSIEGFCNDHDVLCCVKCLLTEHRSCKNVVDLRSDSALLLDKTPQNILDGLKRIESHLMKYVEKNESNLTRLKTETKNLTLMIKQAKHRVISLFDNLEKEVEQDGIQIYKGDFVKISEDNHQCLSLLSAVRQSYQLLDLIIHLGKKTQGFITTQQVKGQLINYRNQVVKKYTKLDSKNVSITLHDSLKNLLSVKDTKLVTVDTITKTEELPLTGIVKTPSQEVSIREASCPCNFIQYDYKGAAYLPDGSVILVDSANKTCCLFDPEFQNTSNYEFSSSPWDVCVVDEREVAVSLPGETKIQFLTSAAPIQPTRSITTRYTCSGLDILSRDKLVVSGYNVTDTANYCWSILTTSGEEEVYHEMDEGIGLSYLALNKSKTHLYMSCPGIDTVYCFGLDGHMYFTYKNAGLIGPMGIGVDIDGNIYVAGNCSENIHQISPDGSLMQIIESKGLTDPLKIAFDGKGSTFLVTDAGNENCYIFQLN